jgi:hypothetical protein
MLTEARPWPAGPDAIRAVGLNLCMFRTNNKRTRRQNTIAEPASSHIDFMLTAFVASK